MRPYDYQPSVTMAPTQHWRERLDGETSHLRRPLRLAYVVCDVFTSEPLTGNPLAVFEGAQVPEEFMQPIARELNLSETVFVCPSASADARLRIFTPRRELPFAGHPTLGASACVARAQGRGCVALETGVGVIEVDVAQHDAAYSFASMKQPLPRRVPFARSDALLDALGIATSPLPIEIFDNGIPHVYVAVATANDLAALAPDMARLVAVSPEAGIACFAPIGADWKVRMFAPAHGVPEDPATGSAAGPLAAYLIAHGLVTVGARLRLEQGAELGRPSELYVETSGAAGGLAEIRVGGGVIRVGRGELCLSPRAAANSAEGR